MFSQFGYRIPPAGGGATIALESLGGGSATGAVAGGQYNATVVTVGTMDKWIICSTITRSVDAGIARISAFDYISSAATHNMALVNEIQLPSPSQGNAACVQHWAVRVNDGINFGTFRRYVDPSGSDSAYHYYNRMRVQGSALDLTFHNEGQATVDTDVEIYSGSFNNNGTTEQTVFTFYRANALGATTWVGHDVQHFNPTLGAVSYIGEASVRTAQTSHVIGATWAALRPACAIATRIKSN